MKAVDEQGKQNQREQTEPQRTEATQASGNRPERGKGGAERAAGRSEPRWTAGPVAEMGKALLRGERPGEDVYSWEHGVGVIPWPEPVEGKKLLDDLETEMKRYAVLGPWAAETLALWVVHTFAWQLRHVATYIGLESPEKRCGKTTLLTVLCEFVNRPVVASNISSPAFFRVIEEKAPTLLIDEADTVLNRNQELKGILNSGYKKKTAYVIRMTPKLKGAGAGGGVPALPSDGRNGGGAPEASAEQADESGLQLGRFSSWCPKAIATIRHLPETLADRCIVIQMHRKTAKEKCERLRTLNGEELRRKCARFVADHAAEIGEARPDLPDDLNDRAADIWEPLIALADLAGADWRQKARAAAVGLTVGAQEASPIASLLMDIFLMFVQVEMEPENEWRTARGGARVFSRNIVATLNADTDRPWMALLRGKQVTERWLSQQLAPYGVRSRTIWIGGTSAKGYMQEDFKEAYKRYMPRALVLSFLEEQRALGRQAKEAEARKQEEAEEARKRAAGAEAKDGAVLSEAMVKPNQSGGGPTVQDLQRNLALLEELKKKAQGAGNREAGGN